MFRFCFVKCTTDLGDDIADEQLSESTAKFRELSFLVLRAADESQTRPRKTTRDWADKFVGHRFVRTQ